MPWRSMRPARGAPRRSSEESKRGWRGWRRVLTLDQIGDEDITLPVFHREVEPLSIRREIVPARLPSGIVEAHEQPGTATLRADAPEGRGATRAMGLIVESPAIGTPACEPGCRNAVSRCHDRA